MFGTTIFDFYQGQRMEHARYLLYEKGPERNRGFFDAGLFFYFSFFYCF